MRHILTFLTLFGALVSHAQSRWILTYTGTETRSVSNRFVTVNVSEKTFIQRCAANAGISTNGLALVLHLGGDITGDSLEVVNINDPNLFRCQIFRFAFPQSNTDISAPGLRRYAYVYDATSDHSRGSALYTITETKSRKGTIPTLNGRLHYWLGIWHETVRDPNAIVATGTFKSTIPLE